MNKEEIEEDKNGPNERANYQEVDQLIPDLNQQPCDNWINFYKNRDKNELKIIEYNDKQFDEDFKQFKKFLNICKFCNEELKAKVCVPILTCTKLHQEREFYYKRDYIIKDNEIQINAKKKYIEQIKSWKQYEDRDIRILQLAQYSVEQELLDKEINYTKMILDWESHIDNDKIDKNKTIIGQKVKLEKLKQERQTTKLEMKIKDLASELVKDHIEFESKAILEPRYNDGKSKLTFPKLEEKKITYQ